MTVGRNYAIAKATLIGWLKNPAPVFQPMKSKIKTNRTLYARFSRALSELQVIARNSDWLLPLFAPVVIGRSNYFGIEFFLQSFEKRSNSQRKFVSKLPFVHSALQFLLI